MPQGSTCSQAGTPRSSVKRPDARSVLVLISYSCKTIMLRTEVKHVRQLPTPKNAQEARRQADIWARADGMFRTGGYTAYHCCGDTWGVYSPAGNAYTLHLNAWTCTCPDFANHGDYCKHLVGLD